MGSERGRMPKLTIMEEVLLLGLKDKQVREAMEILMGAEIWVGGFLAT